MRSKILITIGDINGIGPEIVLKALEHGEPLKRYDLTIVTPLSVLLYYKKKLKLKPLEERFKIISIPGEDTKIQPGFISKESGRIAGIAIRTSVELCRKGKFDAVVTTPISKKALNLSGFKFAGHTEMLTHLCNAKDSVMIMISEKMKMGFASTHPPLKDVAKLINVKMLISKLDVCSKSLVKDFGIKHPKIAILSLNPHAGENGQIGREEIDIITPAIRKARLKRNVTIEGPFPPDSFFANKRYEKFDLTFAMYHDQGFIPFKMIAGLKGVNFTSGLDIIRTSPDHGTAYDIAGKNLANEQSLIEAIKWADRIVKSRSEYSK